ncbi:cation-transporting P-type ATPase [Candidatus Uhrbacteria bacterium]|nr:cation-transporting P-type ATPase [Candidatus Uhrbacteria bacterium]
MTSGGLTTAKAEALRRQHGSNILPEPKRPGLFAIVAEELRNPLLLVLAGAAVVAIAVGERVDGAFILVALALTAAFGVAMAVRAERALRALRSMLAPTARVIRDGHEAEVPARELVPGDRIVLERGMRVPADAQVFEAHDLEVDESVLTGESLPVVKTTESTPSRSHSNSPSPHGGEGEKTFATLWQGTTVVEGSGSAIVTATGTATRLAKIAASLVEPREQTPLQEQLGRLSATLTVLILGLTVVVLLIGLARGVPFGAMLTTAVAVAVAAVPEGLAVAVTAILAIGAFQLARRQCLVRRLIAAETLGSVSVILTDKTGTITEGRMRAVAFRTDDTRYDLTTGNIRAPTLLRALEAVAMGTDVAIANPEDAASTWRFLGSGTEAALVAAAGEHGVDVSALRRRRVDRLPFSAERKYSATFVERRSGDVTPPDPLLPQEGEHERALILIGAPERIVPKLPDTLHRELEELGAEGFRLVGIAVADVPVDVKRIAGLGDPTRHAKLLGVFLLRDPLRMDAAGALAEARTAGIRTVMVTGDYPATAGRIARDVGLIAREPRVCTGDALGRMSDAELRDRIEGFDVFARTVPEQKLRLVRAWRERGAVVAVTGDGVNDAPALIGADVGVAMGSGTDVAREASDLVLIDDHYATIVAGVAGGRVIWDNLRKVTAYLLTSSFSEVILVGGAVALGMPVPILPAQILWVNLVEDLLPAAALAFEPGERGVMLERPRPRGEPLLSRELRTLIFGVGIVSDIVLLAVAFALLTRTHDLALTRTIMFGGLGINALVFVFGIRSFREPIWRSRPFANPHLLIAVAVAAILLVAGLAAPALQPLLRTASLPLWGWGVIAAIGTAELAAIEVVKTIFRRRRGVDA